MKKTFTDEQVVGILRGFEASGLTIKEYCRESRLAKEHFTNGVIDLGQWKCQRSENIDSFNRKTPALKDY
jgi:hypothetical protein